MRWRKKNNSNRYIKNNKCYRFVIAVGLLLILTVVTALVNGQIASADADSDLRAEVDNYKAAQEIRSCKTFFEGVNSHPLYGPRMNLTEENLNGDDGNALTTTLMNNLRPFGEGKITVPESRKITKCDIIYLSNKNGHGDYFAKYFLEHANITDKADGLNSEQSDIKLIPTSNHNIERVKEKLNSNDLRSLNAKASLLRDAAASYPVPNISDAAWGQMYWDAIMNYCTKNKANPFVESGDGEYSYKAQGEDGKYVVKRGYFNGDKGQMISVWPGNHGDTGQADMSCEDAVKKYSELAQKHVDALNKHIDSNPDDSKDTDNPGENGDECAAELNGFGSIICSGQNLFATMTDILYGIISKILEGQTEITKSDPVRTHWGNFLNIANIILIIAFLVVIYSTATSTGGLSNYDVKKLLPRIIIFAIAINLSFYICMALVDLSTILGKGAFGLLMGGSAGAPPQLINSAKKTAGDIAIAGVALVAVAAVLVILVGAPIIMALLAIVFALVVRGIALMILVIVSPIAIALYLFNNQGLSKGFSMWRDNYIKLLLVYPLFMLVWGGTRVVSGLVSKGDQDGINALFVLLVEAICLITPALSIMPLFKMSGDIMGKATIMAASNGAANKFAGWAGSKFTGKPGDPNSPGLRGRAAGAIGGAIGGAAGAAAGRAAGAVQNMRGGASTGNIASQLDDQAMNSARSKVDKYSDRDLKTAFTTGQIGGKTLDPYRMRAVIEKELPNASAAEVKQSMQAVNKEADKLRKNGQAADADRLVQTFANTASANGNSIMSGKSLRNFAASGGWNTSQFEANYADAVADYSSTQLTAQDAAGMDAADLIQMRATLQNAGANGGNIAQADAGLSSIARQSNIALSDPKLARKMSAPTATALNDNTMVRSTAGEKLANTHKIPNIYHDYNTGGVSSATAILNAGKMIRHSDFSKLDAIDQSRLRAIASASVPTGTGAPAAPVVIASWDSRVP